MRSTQMTPEEIGAAEESMGKGTPIVMVNLLRFYDKARYDTGENRGLTGRKAYHDHYVPAFGKIASATAGIKLLWLGEVQAMLVKPADEVWDEIALVEYPSFEAFRHLTESQDYKETADEHRRAALEDWRLIVTVKSDSAGS